MDILRLYCVSTSLEVACFHPICYVVCVAFYLTSRWDAPSLSQCASYFKVVYPESKCAIIQFLN